MNDNSQNNKAVVIILGILAGVGLTVCLVVGLIGYTVLTRYDQAQKADVVAAQKEAEAVQQANALRDRRIPQ